MVGWGRGATPPGCNHGKTKLGHKALALIVVTIIIFFKNEVGRVRVLVVTTTITTCANMLVVTSCR